MFEPRTHARLRHRFRDEAGTELGGVVLDAEALAEHVGVERLEPHESLQPLLEDGDLLVAIHALDLEHGLGVQLADRAGRHFGSSTCV
jgi:hypothetical protein